MPIFNTSKSTTSLCKVKIDLKKDRKLLKTVKVKGDFEGGEELEPEDELWEVLTDIPKKHLHIIVRHPPSTCRFFEMAAALNDYQLQLQDSNT